MSADIETGRRFFRSLLATEKLSASELQRYKGRILEQTLKHAYLYAPFYKESLAPLIKNSGDIDLDRWGDVPILDKPTAQANRELMVAGMVPDSHGEIIMVATGGSTGSSLHIPVSELENLARVCASYRIFHWFGFDSSKKLAMIRKPQAFSGNKGSVVDTKWGYPWLEEEQLGERLRLDISTDPDSQFEWLLENKPAYINTFPSNILTLSLEAANRKSSLPGVRAFISVSELLTDDVRDSCRTHLGCEIIDVLSSAEAGIMAVQCPESGMYHVQSELVHIEVLDDRGNICTPGETGELIVTPLYKFAMPLIRYRMGDYVVQGGECGCGRGLPVIERILGRRQHLFKYADGSMEIPSVNREKISVLLGTRFWQFVQTGPDRAELRANVNALSANTEEAIEGLKEAVPSRMQVTFRVEANMPTKQLNKWHYILSELP